MLVLELLKWAAGHSPRSLADRIVQLLDEGHEREVRWILDAGLGPLLYRATRDRFDVLPSAWRDVLLSAELTAHVRHGALIDTANEVIDVCTDLGTPVTLLKGISTSDQCYPAPHLRPMGDIDILVPREACEAVESSLLRIGYRPEPNHPRNDNMHHAPPLLQPERNVWVELHTNLFPRHEYLAQSTLFSSSNVDAQSTTSTFQGRSVRRLSDELQIAYIASSWMRDLTLSGVNPGFLASLVDAFYLLKRSGTGLDWPGLRCILDNETAVASLYVTLGYISRHRLCAIPQEVISFLHSDQRLVGRFQMRTIHAMLDHYLIGGRPWNLFLPPPVPGRYRFRNQLRKRWPTRLPVPRRST
jgi:hypothetical protein